MKSLPVTCGFLKLIMRKLFPCHEVNMALSDKVIFAHEFEGILPLFFSHRVHIKRTMTSHTPRSQTTIHFSSVLLEVCWTKAYCYRDKGVYSCSWTFQSFGIRILPESKRPYMYVWSFVCVIFTMKFAILLVNSMFNQCHWRSLITTMAFFSIDGTI